jgi:hypothetical protein
VALFDMLNLGSMMEFSVFDLAIGKQRNSDEATND